MEMPRTSSRRDRYIVTMSTAVTEPSALGQFHPARPPSAPTGPESCQGTTGPWPQEPSASLCDKGKHRDKAQEVAERSLATEHSEPGSGKLVLLINFNGGKIHMT